MLAISALSTQYVQVPVTNTEGINPISDVVQFAFIGPYATTTQAADYPPTVSTVWTNGSWLSGATTPTAQILVGPSGGAITLGVGSYQVWLKVEDSPETPILWSGPALVY
jgi:hypothetical protein